MRLCAREFAYDISTEGDGSQVLRDEIGTAMREINSRTECDTPGVSQSYSRIFAAAYGATICSHMREK